MKGKLKHEGDRVWIPGIEIWTTSEMPNSVMAAHAMAMRIMGEDISYAYLMGTSGSAFRLQLHKEWCPSSPHSFCGFETVRGAMAALPYKVQAYEVKKDDVENVKKTRQAVMDSLDKGWPCVYGSEEDGLILGYQKDGQEWLCNHPYKAGVRQPKAYFIEKDWPWGVGIYTEKKDPPPDRREYAIQTLKLAIKLANTDKAGDYFCGYKAWETWINRLRDDELFAKADEESLRTMTHGNAWIYENLIDARKCAAEYLNDIGREFDDAADHVSKAAELYAQVEQKLRAGWKNAPYPQPYGDKPWSRKMRLAEADVLEECLALEKQAIGKIEKALVAID